MISMDCPEGSSSDTTYLCLLAKKTMIEFFLTKSEAEVLATRMRRHHDCVNTEL